MSHPSNKATLENVAEVVSYHQPTPEQVLRHQNIAKSAEAMISAILLSVPECADRTTAIRSVREAKMWASAAIALETKGV